MDTSQFNLIVLEASPKKHQRNMMPALAETRHLAGG
jgi:hypothetical protein